MSETIERPVVRIKKFLFKEDVAAIGPGHEDFGHKGYIEFYGLDGLCIVLMENFPNCLRKEDDERAEETGDYVKVPHVHKLWCDAHEVAIPFVRSTTSKRVVGIYRNKETGAEEHRDERNAWGWDGNREKPSLTPSFIMHFTHTRGDEKGEDGRIPHNDVVFHCFVGDPYGAGTGRYGPGMLDLLESHIKADGRLIPMVLA